MSKKEVIKLKSESEIRTMQEGGEKLSRVKKKLFDAVLIGVSAYEIEVLANELIKKEGAEVSFKKVPGYSWATCINVNAGIVHGIPKKSLIFKKGDIVSVDCGVYYKGFHTDTSFSKELGGNDFAKRFIASGKRALSEAIGAAKAGNRIFDISQKIESELKKDSLAPIRALVGHGVGRDLHEAPQISCFTYGSRLDSPEIQAGMVLAIEVMYTTGVGDIALDPDGWTISTSDGKISGLFEDTVAITGRGHLVLT